MGGGITGDGEGMEDQKGDTFTLEVPRWLYEYF